MAAILHRRDAVVCPLAPDAFAFDATSVDVGQLAIRVGRCTPLLLQASVPQDTVCFVVALAGTQSMRLNGHEARPRSVTVYGAGATHVSANHAQAAWAVVTLTAAEAQDVLPSRPARLGQEGTSATVLTDGAAWHSAVSLFQAVNEVATSEPEVFEVEEARRSLRASVMEAMHELLDGPPAGDRVRLLRQSHGRERVMRAAGEYIRLNAAGVLTVSELAGALGISAARLRRAVHATFGIGASRLLSIRQLLALRAAASGRDQDTMSRRALASAHGFWNLSALERDYQAMFHEPFVPSDPSSNAETRSPKQRGRHIA